MAYVYVTGSTNAPDFINEEFQIKKILYWAAFTVVGQKNAIYGDSIQEYGDNFNISEGDMRKFTCHALPERVSILACARLKSSKSSFIG